ncbi:MAG: ABC transporter substrate-binding protein [Bacteroidales bacterium]
MRYTVVLILIFFSALYSCQRQETTEKKVFRYNEAAGITSLDPAFARNQANLWAVNQIFNGLVQLNDSMNPVPCIAKRWDIRDSGKTYIFSLRNDVFFHDDPLFPEGKGRKVVASDFAYSFSRILDSTIASPGAWVFNTVCFDGFAHCFFAPDDTTFIIRLKESFPPFLGLLSMQYCSVIPYEVASHYGKDFRKHPIGTGPFKFKLWKENVKLVLLKNENYFEFEEGNRLPYLDAIAITFIVDKQSVFLEFVKGNLDFMSGLDASYKDELLTRQGALNPRYRDKFQLFTQPYLNTEYLGFLVDKDLDLVKNSPLSIKEVRQAINYGFDRKKMMRFLRNNIGQPGLYGMVPPGLPSFDSIKVKGYHYDPQKSKDLLSKAGYPGGKGLPEIVLSTNSSYLDLSTYIQQQLNELGFKIKMDVHQAASMREMIAQSKINFFRASWIGDYPDAENYLSLFYSPNFTPRGPNYTHFSNAEFDRLYKKSGETVIPAERFRYYQQMDSMIMAESPVVVLYYDQVLRFTSKNIEGLGNNAMNLLTLKKVRKK